jgi:hypothetical protein
VTIVWLNPVRQVGRHHGVARFGCRAQKSGGVRSRVALVFDGLRAVGALRGLVGVVGALHPVEVGDELVP